MVSRTATKRKALAILALFSIVTFVFFVINAMAVSTFLRENESEASEESVSAEETYDGAGEDEISADDSSETEVEKPELINLQPVVDEWISSVGGQKGVYVYDLDRREVVGEYDADEQFKTASLYKLFVVYEGYRRVEKGEFSPSERVGWEGKDMMECLDLAVRISYSPCAEPIWAMIGHAELDEIIASDYQIEGADISGLSASPRAVGKMMERFYDHPDFNNEENVARMWDSFLNQPITDGYDWRQGLPKGFSESVNVYNKVGWQWTEEDDGSNGHWVVYDDAAIVEFPELARHFVVVVMTSNVRYQSIRQLGSTIEETVLNS